jgi:hypothetical protein
MAQPTGTIQCTGCSKLLNDGRGYANHKRTCKKQQEEATVHLNLRREILEKRARFQAEEVERMIEPSVIGDGDNFGTGDYGETEPMDAEVGICTRC